MKDFSSGALHEYQKHAVRFLTLRLEENRGAALFIDCGLGKTLISLEYLHRQKRLLGGDFPPVFVFAPLPVVYNVWPREVKKFGYDFSPAILHGDDKDMSLRERHDLYLINYEGLPWLSSQRHFPAGKCIFIFDESTRLKSGTGVRYRALKRILPRAEKVILLTGTPAPNSYIDLFSQVFLLDNGEALGTTLTSFRRNYCFQGGFQGRQWFFNTRLEPHLRAKIAPMVLRLDRRDHLSIPAVLYNHVEVELPEQARSQYNEIEKSLFTLLDSGESLIADTASAAYSMCRSIANGGCYRRDPVTGELLETIALHTAKTDAAMSLIAELSGKSVLLVYQFKHDRERLERALSDTVGKNNFGFIGGGTKLSVSKWLIDRFNDADLRVLAVQPQAVSHGVNLQSACCDVIWYGLPDSLETWLQTNSRVDRQGQLSDQVRIHIISASNTIDSMLRRRLIKKESRQTTLLAALLEYQKSKK